MRNQRSPINPPRRRTVRPTNEERLALLHPTALLARSPPAPARSSRDILDAAHGTETVAKAEEDNLAEPVVLNFENDKEAKEGDQGAGSTKATRAQREAEWKKNLEEVEKLEEEAEVEVDHEEDDQPSARRTRFNDTNNSFQELSDHEYESDVESDDWEDAMESELSSDEEMEDDSADEAAAESEGEESDNKNQRKGGG